MRRDICFELCINIKYIRHLSRGAKVTLRSSATTFEDNSRRLIFQSSFIRLVRMTRLARPSFGASFVPIESPIIMITFLQRERPLGAFTSFVTCNGIQSWFGPPSMRRFQFRGIKTRRWMRGWIPYIGFYVGCIRRPADIPRVWLSISIRFVESAPLSRRPVYR